jgi:hypothetical protein
MPQANSTPSDNHSDSVTQSDGTAGGSVTESNQPITENHGAAGRDSMTDNNSGNSNPDNSGGSGLQGSPAQGHAAPGAAGNTVPNLGELVAAIQAMPESVVRALREAQPPAQQRRQAQSATDTGQQAQDRQAGTQAASQPRGESRTPGRKTFADWWFGR